MVEGSQVFIIIYHDNSKYIQNLYQVNLGELL